MTKIYNKHCKYCGDPFESKSKQATICSCCRELKSRKPREQKANQLDKLLQEIAEYNRTHEKALSYGEYVAKFNR